MSHRGHEAVPEQRAIIDRRVLADRLNELKPGKKLPAAARVLLADALSSGRAEIASRLAIDPGNGRGAAQATAFLHDQLVRLA